VPTFLYKAKQGPGKTVEGELAADSRTAAVAAVDAMGLSPVWVREKPAALRRGRAILGARRVSYRDVSVFTRQLASLTKSSVPILRALATIGEQTENGGLRRIVEDVESSIRDGNMLSSALAKYPSLFPELYVSMVRSGESGGVLDRMLFRLSEAREKEDEVRRKVQSALAYPVLVLCVGVATVVALFAFFLPKIVALFDGYESLPLPTRILISLSHFFSDQWYWMALVLLLSAAVFNRLAAIEKGRTFIDAIKLRLPVIRKFILEADVARFCRTLSLLVEAGIQVDKAISLSANTLANAVLRDEIEEVRRNTVLQGAPLSEGLRRTRHFPVFVANMAAVGEEAGRLDESLEEVASFYEKEVDQHTRLATSLLEPMLILAVGAIVGFIVAAMLLPIFEIGTGV